MERFSNARKFFQRDLGLQIFVAYMLFIGMLLIGALVVNDLAGDRLRSDIQAADRDLAQVVSKEVQSYQADLVEIADQLAHHSAVINIDPSGMEELFRTLTIGRSNISVIYFLDTGCRPGYSYRPGIGSGAALADPIWVPGLCTNESSAAITPGHISPISGQPVATIASPVQSLIDRQVIGWIAIDFRLNDLNDLARLSVQHRPEEGFQVYVIDGSDQIIARSDFNPNALLIDAAAEFPQRVIPAEANEAENWIAEDAQGEEQLFSTTRMDGGGWQVVISRPTQLAFTTPRAFNRGLSIAVVIFFLVGLLFWMMLSRRVIRPLERLAVHSRRIAQESRPLEGSSLSETRIRSDELGALSRRGDQIGGLVRSLIRAEKVLAARFNELETLLHTGAAVVSTLDLQTVLDRILEQVELLMGLDVSAIIALDEKRGVFVSQASRHLSQHYTEQIKIHPGEPVSVTMQALETGRPVQVSDIETDPNRAALRPRARAEGIRAMLAVPLNMQHAPPAALLVYDHQPHAFTAQEINLLTNFAVQAAMALENATLFSRSDMQLQEQTLRMEALIQSMRDGLIMENLQGQVVYANRMTEELTGLSSGRAVRKPMIELIERILQRSRSPDQARAAIQNALLRRDNRRVDLEIFPALKSGARFLRMRIFDVTDDQDVLIGRGLILHDITRRREIDRMRSSLISTVSHELRTPLAAIKGYATTLLSEDVEWDSISQREFLEIISSETDRLTELVKDLLDMSRIEAGNLSIARVPCDLEEMIVHAARRSRTPPGERLSIRIPPEIPDLFLDPQRMEVVFRNLIENAVKYSAKSASIRVTAGLGNGEVIVRVEDEGMGVPESQQGLIFESFYRVENGLARSTPGAGLGLSICQGFVQAHGGRIWYEPRARGSCFAFSLPIEVVEGGAGR